NAIADSVSSALERQSRLSILRFLANAPRYTLNGRVLFDLLDAFGICLSHDRLDRTLSWLREQQLVKIERSELVVVTITEKGSDVVDGRAINPEVPRP